MSEGALTRRSVTTGATVTVVGGVVGFAVASSSSAADPKPPAGAAAGGAGTRLAGLDEVPDGGGLVLDNLEIVLTRDGGDVLGFSAVCTHQGCNGATVSGGTINCPCHGSQFDAKTGEVVGGPAPTPLESVPVVVRDGGVFTAGGDAGATDGAVEEAAAAGAGAAAAGRLAELSEIPAGGGLILGDEEIVITRGQGDQVWGFSAICTHQGCPVGSVSGGTINCPCHGSKFDARTGEVVGGPAPSPLERRPVVVRDGAVFRA